MNPAGESAFLLEGWRDHRRCLLGRKSLAKRNTLCRVCGAPTAHAESIPHSASYPALAKSLRMVPKNRPSSLESSPGTFSTTTHLGLTSQTSRCISDQRVLRSPLSPWRFPEQETSWHGNPPQIMSTALGRTTSRISVYRLTSGQ